MWPLATEWEEREGLKQVTAQIILRVANSISGDQEENDKVISEEFGMRPPMVAI